MGNNPPAADEIRLSPDGSRAFVSVQGKHVVVPVPRTGRDTVEVRVQARGDATAVPLTRLSQEGGDYLMWTADSQDVTWSMGSLFFRQSATGAGEPQRMAFAVERPRSRPTGSVLLTGARIITMKGDEVLPRGDVLVTNNRIAAIGGRGSVRAPAGTRTIDVTGKTIMPGLVDAHSHMWAPRGPHQTEVWQYLANLAYGVTTTRDPQTSTTDVFAYADMVDAGMMPGRASSRPALESSAASGIEDRDSAFRYMKRYRDAYRTNTIKQYVAGDRLVRQWLIQAAKEYGITATIEGSLDLKLNLTQMADGYSGQEHSLPIMPIYKDVVEFVARTKTFYTPTILVAYGAPWSENFYFETENTAADAEAARGGCPRSCSTRWCAGARSGSCRRSTGTRRSPSRWPTSSTPAGALRSAATASCRGWGRTGRRGTSGPAASRRTRRCRVVTLFGAEAIGLQQDVGSLEAGKMADLLVLDRNPLENIRNTNSIRYVMKNGELYEGDTLNMVWPEAQADAEAVLGGLRSDEDDLAGPVGRSRLVSRRACAVLSGGQAGQAGHHQELRQDHGRRTPHFLAIEIEVQGLQSR